MQKRIWQIPIRTISEANSSEHWAKKSQRRKQQRYFIQIALQKDIRIVTLPCHIKLIRISRRLLDYDNLVSSQKAVMDAICDLLIPGLAPGRADGDIRITSSYDQEKGKKYGIRIEIEF